MDKGGWGLTLKSSESVEIFKEKSVLGYSLTPTTPSWLNPTKTGGGASMFPVNLNRREDHAAASSAAGVKRAVELNEVDFFSEKKPPPPPAVDNIVVKKESGSRDEHNTTRPDLNVNTGLELVIANNGGSHQPTTIDDSVSREVERRRAKNELAAMQVELERMSDENKRLKGMLSQATNNYGALLAMVQQQTSRTYEVVDGKSEEKGIVEGGGKTVARQFLDVAGPSGGAGAGGVQTEEASHNSRTSSGERTDSETPRNIGREESLDSETWRPDKVPSRLNPSNPPVDDQAASAAEAAATMRKARVSVRARSEASMISDGCQWRKYGQKMAKGNPCPRAYYRCTMADRCPVRIQVQRCANDRTILNTTYEGTHNHPLPPAAMAMATTTSSAANMLLSGTMPSADVMMNPNFLGRAIYPCSGGIATISASAPFPTITLDLTHQAPNSLPNYPRPPTTQFPFSNAPQNHRNYFSVPQVFGQAQVSNIPQHPYMQHPSYAHDTQAPPPRPPSPPIPTSPPSLLPSLPLLMVHNQIVAVPPPPLLAATLQAIATRLNFPVK